MAHGLNSVIKRGAGAANCKPEGKTGIGSRRIFSPQFKLQVLDSYRKDAECKGNQRATARKYGIHRRQIQKWLQVENTLRSGVGGKQQPAKSSELAALNGHRQRDDDGSAARSASLAGEARVPALEPPAGWRPHQAPLCVPDPAAPMDLSLKRAALVPSPPTPRYLPPAGPSPGLPPQPDVWDLSTKRKAEDEGASIASSKPIKLFKPYLDNLDEQDCAPPPTPFRSSPPTPFRSSPPMLYCCQPPLTCSPDAYYLNNNNLCCDVKSSPDYPPYTLHELQPKGYYCPYYPTSEYELSPTYCPYEDHVLMAPVPMKQRQSYSLDFKLSAIESYYQDSMCKGNQRAVASKYNVHRRQVQKWLKQEDELKSRSEGLKETHAVR